MAVLETRGLRKAYGQVVALDGLDLSVERGEVFGFLGPNGAGKTTFTKCVTGFVRPQSGTVRVCGIDALAHPTQVAARIGLVPDQYDFYPNLTGRQHLDFYARLHGMGREERKARIAEVLDMVGMPDRADRRIKTYSHGMKQRICIGQAILHRPELILFDEPTNGLDPKGAFELREMMRGLAKDGTTVFLNSHQLSEVEQVCGRVAIVDRGRLVAVDSVRALQKRASGNAVEVRVLNPSAKLVTAAAKFTRAKPVLDGNILRFAGGDEETANVLTALVAAGARVVSVQQTGSLEAAFLQLTTPPEVAA